jgi:hypothetical protein
MKRISGTVHDGEWRLELELPRYAAQGNYEVNAVQLRDRAGNFTTYDRSELEALGSPVTFLQTGAGDEVKPQVLGLEESPTVLHASQGEATFEFRLRVSDDLIGIDPADPFSTLNVGFDVPGDPASFEWSGSAPVLVSGDTLDGTWLIEERLPSWAPTGTYTVSEIGVADRAGNFTRLQAPELEAEGWDLSFENLP